LSWISFSLVITDDATPFAQKYFHIFGPLKDAPRGTFEDRWDCDSCSEDVATWTGNELVQGRQACPCFGLA
jgi:hypothetical protein